MKTCRTVAALTMAVAVLAAGTAHAGSVQSAMPTILRGTAYSTMTFQATPDRMTGTFSGLGAGSGTSGGVALLNSVGFVNGSQVFSDAISVPSAGTLTVKLAGLSWLDALQNLNCFVSAPGGGIVGTANNGGLDSVQVQPGTVYVNWYAQASAPLHLGAYSLSVNFQPNASSPPPVPLPPALLLMLSGLAALAPGLRRSRLKPPVAD